MCKNHSPLWLAFANNTLLCQPLLTTRYFVNHSPLWLALSNNALFYKPNILFAPIACLWRWNRFLLCGMKMERPAGIEPATPGLGILCSIP